MPTTNKRKHNRSRSRSPSLSNKKQKTRTNQDLLPDPNVHRVGHKLTTLLLNENSNTGKHSHKANELQKNIDQNSYILDQLYQHKIKQFIPDDYKCPAATREATACNLKMNYELDDNGVRSSFSCEKYCIQNITKWFPNLLTLIMKPLELKYHLKDDQKLAVFSCPMSRIVIHVNGDEARYPVSDIHLGFASDLAGCYIGFGLLDKNLYKAIDRSKFALDEHFEQFTENFQKKHNLIQVDEYRIVEWFTVPGDGGAVYYAAIPDKTCFENVAKDIMNMIKDYNGVIRIIPSLVTNIPPLARDDDYTETKVKERYAWRYYNWKAEIPGVLRSSISNVVFLYKKNKYYLNSDQYVVTLWLISLRTNAETITDISDQELRELTVGMYVPSKR